MIVEQRTYSFHPGAVPKFLALYTPEIRALQARVLGNLLGYFVTEIGPLNQTVHLWGFESFDERQRRRAEMMTHDEWRAFLAALFPLLISQETKLLNPLPFSPIR